MMRITKELNVLKEEVETVSKKLHQLIDEDLAQVSGGGWSGFNDQQNIIPPSAESLIAPAPCNEGGQGCEPSMMQPVFGGHGLCFNIQPVTPQTMEPQVTPLPYV